MWNANDSYPNVLPKVLEAAKNGFKAHGVELNPWLVAYSKFRAIRLGLTTSATFSRQDLWKTDFSKFNNVVIFGVEEMVGLEIISQLNIPCMIGLN